MKWNTIDTYNSFFFFNNNKDCLLDFIDYYKQFVDKWQIIIDTDALILLKTKQCKYHNLLINKDYLNDRNILLTKCKQNGIEVAYQDLNKEFKTNYHTTKTKEDIINLLNIVKYK